MKNMVIKKFKLNEVVPVGSIYMSTIKVEENNGDSIGYIVWHYFLVPVNNKKR